MLKRYYMLATAAFLTLALVVCAQSVSVPVATAHGKVTKADNDSVTLQPRDGSGKFGKAITLKLTGTSRVTILAPQKKSDKKLVMAQKEASPKDLAAGQTIAVIYASPAGQDQVVLSAVIQAEK